MATEPRSLCAVFLVSVCKNAHRDGQVRVSLNIAPASESYCWQPGKHAASFGTAPSTHQCRWCSLLSAARLLFLKLTDGQVGSWPLDHVLCSVLMSETDRSSRVESLTLCIYLVEAVSHALTSVGGLPWSKPAVGSFFPLLVY